MNTIDDKLNYLVENSGTVKKEILCEETDTINAYGNGFSITFKHKPLLFCLTRTTNDGNYIGIYLNTSKWVEKYGGKSVKNDYLYFSSNSTVNGLSSISGDGLTFNFNCNTSWSWKAYSYYIDDNSN